MFRKKIGREKETKSLSGMNPLTFSKLKRKEIAEELFTQKLGKLMQAWFTLKGKVEKSRRSPANQSKLFAVQ